MKPKQDLYKCVVCGTKRPRSEMVAIDGLRPEFVALIRQDAPDMPADGVICHDDLLKYRHRYVADMLLKEKSELSALDKSVIASIAGKGTLTENVDSVFDEKLTLGDRWADRIATFGGSWAFIGSFAAVMAAWIVLNLSSLIATPFDPYPFILLNLVLSCLAAVQAPLIMMSQRRQETKDRLRSQNDYRVNLKAELEIRLLHEKLDHLLLRQWERLAEIQQIQLDLMEEIARGRKNKT
jgi:uncharacterized membrane protein